MIETADISALREELVRRFRTTTRDLELAGRTIRLLMPANTDELISEADFKSCRCSRWSRIIQPVY